jgi:hypothetical protein
MPDDTIYTRLTTHTGLTALIAEHVYPGEMPSKAEDRVYPLCVYTRVSDVPSVALDWTIYDREARYQVSCYATKRKDALAVAEQVISALHGYVSAPIKRARFENLTEIVEPGAGPTGEDLFAAHVDFLVNS